MIKISVIVPCFNVEKYIEKCLDSLIGQTLTDIEIICIDDKSTDTTLEIIQKFATRDKRIKVIAHQKNQGVATTRNSGLEIAKGQYIGFVDPDDWIDADFLEKLYENAKKNDSDVAKARVVNTNAQTGETSENWGVDLQHQHIAYFTHAFWSAIYKREFLGKHNIMFPDGLVLSEDSVFLTKVCTHTNKISFVNDTAYHYLYLRPHSLDSVISTHKKAQSALSAMKMNLETIEKAKLGTDDFVQHMTMRVLSTTKYEMNKRFEDKNDKKKFFELLVHIYKKHKCMKAAFNTMFKHGAATQIKNNNFRKYIKLTEFSHKRVYLFNFIPMICIQTRKSVSYVKLFEFIPLFRISDNGKKIYLFNCIPLLKFRG